MVATLDLSAPNIGALKADHWLRDEKNAILLALAEEAFIRTPLLGSHLPRPSSPTRPAMVLPPMSAPYPLSNYEFREEAGLRCPL